MTKREYDRNRYAATKTKRKAQMLAWRIKNRKRLRLAEKARRAKLGDKIKRYQRAYYRKNKARIAEQILKQRYRGALAPTRARPLTCECCGRKASSRRLHLDHCHVGKRFRGWLCSQCNTGLGLLGDNLKGLMKAVKYLRRVNVRRKAAKRCARGQLHAGIPGVEILGQQEDGPRRVERDDPS